MSDTQTSMPLPKERVHQCVLQSCSYCNRTETGDFPVVGKEGIFYCESMEHKEQAETRADFLKRELAGHFAYLLDLTSVTIPRSDGSTSDGLTVIGLIRVRDRLCAECVMENFQKNVPLEDLARLNPLQENPSCGNP